MTRGLFLVGILPCLCAVAGAAAPKMLRAGAAQVNVTPEKLPVITNCQMLERRADKVTNPLFARSLVLDDGATRIAITVVDSCMLPRELLDRAKEMAHARIGIPVERMMISATHTHTAPASMGCLGTDVDTGYAAWLPGKIAEAIAAAAAKLEPAQAGWAVENDWEHTHCRRWIFRADKMRTDPFGNVSVRANMHPGYQNPDAISEAGPVDPAVTVLSVQTPQGKPLALLANYSMHYFGDAHLSPDYYGLFARKIAAKVGAAEGFVGMMSQGTSGDQMWMDYGRPKSDITIDAYAGGVTDTAWRAYRKIRYEKRVTVAMAEKRLLLRRRTPDAQRLAWARKVMDRPGGPKPKNQTEVYAREQLLLDQEPERELKLQAIRVGGLGIVAIPDEVFAITGLKLKAQSPLALTMNIELANGAEGYIPPPEQHKLGGYTTWPARSAGLEVQAEPRIVEAALGLLEAVAGKPRRNPVEPEGSYARAVLASKPAHYWRLDEFEGTTARARTGGLDAIYEDGVALYLPGAQEGGRAPHLAGGRLVTPVRDLGKDYTVELWFWSGVKDHAVFSMGAEEWKAGEGVPLRQWQHVALVREGSRLRIYRNGVMEEEREARGEPNGAVVFGDRFEGKVDEAAIYRRALPEAEIKSHFSQR